MHRVCRCSVILQAVTAILATVLSGCAAPPAATMTLGEWITLLDQKAGLSAAEAGEPYFLNVPESSPYYEAVQAAVEWEVLDGSVPFDPYQVLTREWTAYTLMNLSERDVKQDTNISIRDLSTSMFPKHVSASVAHGLLSLDRHDRFLPREPIDRTEALNCLSVIAGQIDRRTAFEPHLDYEFSEEAEFTEEEPEVLDPEENTAVFRPDAAVETGQYFTSGDPAQPEAVYRIQKTEEKEDGIHAIIEPAKAEDVFSAIDAAETFEVDFTKAKIIDAIDGTVIQDSDTLMDFTTPAALRSFGYEKTHEINGYHISYSVSATGIKAEVTKKTKNGLEVFGNLQISSVKPSYRWKTENGTIQDGYFTMEFQSAENLGASIDSYRKLYGDFSKVEPGNFLGTIRNLFQEHADPADITLPLAKIVIPVPSQPLLTLLMQLELTIRAEGKAQLALSQDNCIGMEIRNGHMRRIGHSDMNAQAMLQADTALLGGVKMAMKLAGMSIADMKTEAGAKAKADALVHLYDNQNNHAMVRADGLPSDFVEDLSDGNENVFSCTDITAYKTIDIRFNSADTLAGRAGLSADVVIADEKNGEMIPGLNGHWENGHRVAKCTRKDRPQAKDTGPVVESDQIRIADYSMILDPGETKSVQIRALPKGYSAKDLVLTSDNPSVAGTSALTVTGKAEGSSIIHIRTSDGKYEVSCSVLVRHKQ